ncbi:MAG: 5-formyltetrahydrofolate cyclo-ligase [Ruminococcaceae bacterium]|nr:5-formyltetrahydrofolate cyclo-ligase [Oscillospiraceae bacterium]
MISDKSELRRHYLALRTSLGDTSKQAAELINTLLRLPEWQSADVICSYMPTRDELDVTPLMAAALSSGKGYALPLTLSGAASGEMVFCLVTTPDDLSVGRFGIREPLPHCPRLTCAQLERALCVVPALAFDTDGYRLGYGGGYYDRFLKNFNGISVGLAIDACMSPTPLPRTEFDVAVDILIGERQVIRTNEQ